MTYIVWLKSFGVLTKAMSRRKLFRDAKLFNKKRVGVKQ